MASQEDDASYSRVTETLEEAKLMSLKSTFKANGLEDETLDMMDSEQELRSYLSKEINPPLKPGEAFKFSRFWFRPVRKGSSEPIEPPPRMPSMPYKTTTSSEKDSVFRFDTVQALDESTTGQASGTIGTRAGDAASQQMQQPPPEQPDRWSGSEIVVFARDVENVMDGEPELCGKETTASQVEILTKPCLPARPEDGKRPDTWKHPPTGLGSKDGTAGAISDRPETVGGQHMRTNVSSDVNVDVEHSIPGMPEHRPPVSPIIEKANDKKTPPSSQNAVTDTRIKHPTPVCSTDSKSRTATSQAMWGQDGKNGDAEENDDHRDLPPSGAEVALLTSSTEDSKSGQPGAEHNSCDIHNGVDTMKRESREKPYALHSEDNVDVHSNDDETGTEPKEKGSSSKNPKQENQEPRPNGPVESHVTTGEKWDAGCSGKGEESKPHECAKEGPNKGPKRAVEGTEQQSNVEAMENNQVAEDSASIGAAAKSISKERQQEQGRDSEMTTETGEHKETLSEGSDTQFSIGYIIEDTNESRIVDFKSFAGEMENRLPWKIMEKAKRFICGCLNSPDCKKGVIYFGVGDGQSPMYKRGEVHGLDVESSEISEAFHTLLDEHLRIHGNVVQKAGELEQCVRLRLVPVASDESEGKHVVEIEVSRDWNLCKSGVYCSRRWTGKRKSKNENRDRTALQDFFHVATDTFEIVKSRSQTYNRESSGFPIIKDADDQTKLQELLRIKHSEWEEQNPPDAESTCEANSIEIQDKDTSSKTSQTGETEITTNVASPTPQSTHDDELANRAGITDLSRPQNVPAMEPNPCAADEMPKESTESDFGQGRVRDEYQSVAKNRDDPKAMKCKPRPFRSKGRDTWYPQGSVLEAEENRVVEFKSFGGESKSRIHWKMMEKAKKFICGCLNSGEKGVIYFGVEDEQPGPFKRGEVRGLDVGSLIDDIAKAFQALLDDHIWTDDSTKMQKGGDQQCIRLEFVPVTLPDGQRTSLYVVEIEVSRNWALCTDKVYYSKTWKDKEKRCPKLKEEGDTLKPLSDCYKVDKDDFDDVAIRTNASTSSVKKLDVEKQVKQPLEAKYKDWKRQNKSGLPETRIVPQMNAADTQKISSMLRERLYNLNYKEYDFILITNKLSSELRGTPHLSFLRNIPWTAVFDVFDPSTKKDGLHYVCNETTDAPRAVNMMLEDFKQDVPLPSRETAWVSCKEVISEDAWIERYKDCFYQAITTYKSRSLPGHLVCVFLALSETSIKEMAEVMECCVNILGESASKSISLLPGDKAVAESLIKASRKPLKQKFQNCTIGPLPWSLLEENVEDMVGPSKFEDKTATTDLPYWTGKPKKVLNKKIYSWNDLEIYSPNPKLSAYVGDIEKARDTFYKGGQVQQMNLFQKHDIERTLKGTITEKVDNALAIVAAQHRCNVEVVKVPYEAGSGATTLCRRILWEKRTKYRCAVVKALTSNTGHQIDELQKIAYDDTNYALPVVVLVDNVPETELVRLCDRLETRQTKCVVLSAFPISEFNKEMEFDVPPMKQLDPEERNRVRNILMNVTKDEEKRKDADIVLEREKRFIWFGLELFGTEYIEIEEKLSNHIDGILMQTSSGRRKNIYEAVVNFCCLLHLYNDCRTIFPHPIVADYLWEGAGSGEFSQSLEELHDKFGGLLLEDYCDTHGYYGWRPAHPLVSKVVKSRMNLEETSMNLLEKMLHGQTYTKKYLAQEVVKMFLQRRKICKPTPLKGHQMDEGIGSDFDFDAWGLPETRTKYSPLIMDIVSGNGIKAAPVLFIKLCEQVTEIEDKAYSWQQLARFIGYEFGIAEVDEHHRDVFVQIHSAIEGVLKKENKLVMPKTAIEAAHASIDVAIGYQQSYSNHYVTKGHLYRLELRAMLNDRTGSMDGVFFTKSIDVCEQALNAYNKGEACAWNKQKYYPVFGKIAAMTLLLKIIKSLPCFSSDARFTRYLNDEQTPEEVKDVLSDEQNSYIQNFRVAAPSMINQVFRDVKLRRMTTWERREIQSLDDTCLRMFEIRGEFYSLTGLVRSSGDVRMVSIPSNPRAPPVHAEQLVQEILYEKSETPYSNWDKMPQEDISKMYDLLKYHCQIRGSHDAMVTCCRACLMLNERPPVDELKAIVTTWVALHPSSEWAHMFNYMLHFPIPNASLAVGTQKAIESSKQCGRLVTERTGKDSRKKSRAEYFLGKGKGLDALVCAVNMPWRERDQEKTEFWRSLDVFDTLERVCGQKDVQCKGVLFYQGIRVTFDDSLYPKQSRDELWFFLGFTAAGPYAFDPLSQDDYENNSEHLRKMKPSLERAKPSGSLDYSGFGRGTRHRESNGHFPGSPSSSSSEEGRRDRAKRPGINVKGNSPCTVSLLEYSPCSRRTAGSLSFDDLGISRPPAPCSIAHVSRMGSYAHAAERANGDARRAKSTTSLNTSTESPRLKSVDGVKGDERKSFEPVSVDHSGKVHHGAFVLGLRKAKDCERHLPGTPPAVTDQCSFAHSWRGDTLQHVCLECTKRGYTYCKEKLNHKASIWNLGPYYDEKGDIWRSRHQSRK